MIVKEITIVEFINVLENAIRNLRKLLKAAVLALIALSVLNIAHVDESESKPF